MRSPAPRTSVRFQKFSSPRRTLHTSAVAAHGPPPLLATAVLLPVSAFARSGCLAQKAGRAVCDLPCLASPTEPGVLEVHRPSGVWRVACGALFLRLDGTPSWGRPSFVYPVVSDGCLGDFHLGPLRPSARAFYLNERLFEFVFSPFGQTSRAVTVCGL